MFAVVEVLAVGAEVEFEARSFDLFLWLQGSSRSGSTLEASSAMDLWVGFGHTKTGEVNNVVQF